MPVMDGYEATKLLRKDPIEAVRSILVIAMTVCIYSLSLTFLIFGMYSLITHTLLFFVLEFLPFPE